MYAFFSNCIPSSRISSEERGEPSKGARRSKMVEDTEMEEEQSQSQVVRARTRRCPIIREDYFWDILLTMKLSSVQRRHNGYKEVYIQKMLEGWVTNSTVVEAKW